MAVPSWGSTGQLFRPERTLPPSNSNEHSPFLVYPSPAPRGGQLVLSAGSWPTTRPLQTFDGASLAGLRARALDRSTMGTRGCPPPQPPRSSRSPPPIGSPPSPPSPPPLLLQGVLRLSRKASTCETILPLPREETEAHKGDGTRSRSPNVEDDRSRRHVSSIRHLSDPPHSPQGRQDCSHLTEEKVEAQSHMGPDVAANQLVSVELLRPGGPGDHRQLSAEGED